MEQHIVGIDEAGYGPRLGPLVVSACVLRLAGDAHKQDGSDLWRALADCVAPARRLRKTARRSRRILIGDSKLVYTPARGPADLERAVLALIGWANGRAIGSVQELFAALHCPDGSGEPWERREDGRFPLGETALPVPPLAPRRAAVAPVAIESRMISPAELNRLHRATHNKAAISWNLVAELLRRAWARVDYRPLCAVIDRQGGRVYYAGILADTFPGAVVELVRERRRESRYRVSWRDSSMDVVVRVEADRSSLPVAVASMVSKYARELMMARLNGFFLHHAPELRATAGYYGDASRFLRETAALRRQLGVEDARFVRRA